VADVYPGEGEPPTYAYESPAEPETHRTASPTWNLLICTIDLPTVEAAVIIASSARSPPVNGITIAELALVAIRTALCTVPTALDGVVLSFPVLVDR
jgi:hypothetical protein